MQPELPAADLAPLVLRKAAVQDGRAPAGRRIGWFVPVFQGAAVVLFCVLGWSALATRWGEMTQRFPAESLRAAWVAALARGRILWAAIVAQWQTWWTEAMPAVPDLPTALARVGERWPHLPGLEFTAVQVLAIGLAAALVWLAGNSILLWTAAARPVSDRHFNHR